MLGGKQDIALSKHDSFQIFAKVYKKLEKEKFIENTITKFRSLMEDGLDKSNQQESMNQGRQTS